MIILSEKIKQLSIEMPDRVCLSFCDRDITYSELENAAKIVANNLDKLMEKEDIKHPVAILLEHTAELYFVEFGVAKMGIPYMPLSTEYPFKRIQDCISDVGCRVLITDDSEVSDLAMKLGNNVKVIPISKILETNDSSNNENTKYHVEYDTPFIAVYTSGSTGKAKGMIHTNQAILELISGDKDNYPLNTLTENNRNMMAITKPNFIAGLFNHMAIYNIARAFIPSPEEFTDFTKLKEKIISKNITAIFASPSFVKNMLNFSQGEDIIKHIQVLSIGSEKTSKSLVKKIYNINSEIIIVHHYGCSETCGPCVCGIMDEKCEEGTIGKTMGKTSLFIVDDEQNILPHDMEGELMIVGNRVVDDYVGHASGSKKFFKYNGQNAFLTGDYGKLTSDNVLILSGRRDDMVKFHGQRVELGDIENALSNYPGIILSSALLMNNGMEDYLGLFYTASSEIKPNEIKLFLSESLPQYMVPQFIKQLQTMPLNTHGKINRTKLKEMGNYGSRVIDAPTTEKEKICCDAFAHALGLDKFGLNEDFFEMGGTSLGLANIVSSLSDKGIEIRYTDINNNPTPALLSAFIESKKDNLTLDLDMDRECYPLTKTQYGVYREVQMGSSTETYSIPYIMRAAKSVKAEDLAKAVEKVVNAHSGMKYNIQEDKTDALPYMYMHPEMKIEVPVIKGEAKDRLEWIKNFKPHISVTDDTLFNFAVYETSEGCFLMMKTHMIFQDATSTKILIEELNRALKGKELIGESFTIQKQALLEEKCNELGLHEEARKHYQNVFKEMTENSHLEGDIKGELTQGESKNARFETGELSTSEIRDFCNKLHISESTFFSATLGLLLSKYLYQDKISFSFVYNGRSHDGAKNAVGTFIKRVPFFCKFAADCKCSDYLKDSSRQMMANMANDLYTFDEALKELPVNEDVEFLYQGSMFTDDVNLHPENEMIKGDPFFVENYHTGMVTGLLSLAVFSTGNKYTLSAEYRNERFSYAWVENFAQRFFKIAKELVIKENLGDISICSNKEIMLIEKSNDTKEDVAFIPVHKMISKIAYEEPEKTALIFKDSYVNYKELDEASNRIALKLKKLGVANNEAVAVYFDRTPECVMSEIGILKAGAAFVPFAADCPFDRLAFCLNEVAAKFILTDKMLKEKIPKDVLGTCNILDISELLSDDKEEVYEKNNTTQKLERTDLPEVHENDLAYIIYTSGSTGKPKGVMIEHHSFANYVTRSEKSVEIMHYGSPHRVCLALAAFSFDVSIVETYVPLCNGGTVCIATEEEIHNPLLLANRIVTGKVDTMTCTPTYIQNLLQLDEMRESLGRITLYDIGAEAFIPKLFNDIKAINKDAIILNVYGPTECTMGCTANVVESVDECNVGKPNLNTKVYVTDIFGNMLPPGIKGELIILGEQLARGYVGNNPTQMKAFINYNGDRAYKSGDIASWDESGNIWVYGRKDSQVKLHGFRIETDEIARELKSIDGIKNCVVMIRDYGSSQGLVAFYVSKKDLDNDLLKAQLSKMLPHYMIPSVFVPMESFPITASGKVDTKELSKISIENKRKRKAPKSSEEINMCKLFAKTLNLNEEDIGISDDFFDLGGNSLTAMVLVAQEKDIGITVSDIYKYRTIEKLVKNKKNSSNMQYEELIRIERELREKPAHLTGIQTMFLDKGLISPDLEHIYMNAVKKMDLSVDVEKLCKAINKVIHHFAAFATIINVNKNDGSFYMEYRPDKINDVKIEYIDEEEYLKEKSSLTDVVNKFNDLLYNIRLFKTEKNIYLYLSISHIISDATSLYLLSKSIYLAYNDEELPPDFLYSYFDEMWKENNGKLAKNAKKYYDDIKGNDEWCNSLKPDLKAKFNHGGILLPINIDFEKLRSFEKKYNVGGNIVAILASSLAISEEEKSNNIIQEWLYNNRTTYARENTFGPLFSGQLVFLKIDSYANIADMVNDVKKQIEKGILYGDYWYEGNTYVPYFNESMFVNYLYVKDTEEERKINFGGTVENILSNKGFAIFDMNFTLIEAGEKLTLLVSYNKGMYSDEKIARLIKLFEEKLDLLLS